MEIQALQTSTDAQRLQDRGISSGEGESATEAVNRARSVSGDFFISPILKFDSRALTVIFQVRDRESGDVTRQFPAEAVVERYRNDPSARPFVPSLPASAPEEEAVVVDLATGPAPETTDSGTAPAPTPAVTDNGAPPVATTAVPAAPQLAPSAPVNLVA